MGLVLKDATLAKVPLTVLSFENVEMDKLVNMQKELFSYSLGGPHTYSGRPLREVHAGLGITLYHFQRFREHLLSTLQDAGVDADDIHEVIHRVTSMRKDIVG